MFEDVFDFESNKNDKQLELQANCIRKANEKDNCNGSKTIKILGSFDPRYFVNKTQLIKKIDSNETLKSIMDDEYRTELGCMLLDLLDKKIEFNTEISRNKLGYVIIKNAIVKKKS